MVAGWQVSKEESKRGAVLAMARSVARKPLPPVPADLWVDDPKHPPTSICLFYQYVEPAWTPRQHRAALCFVMQLGKKLGVTGRGRCATEGLNCTMTGTAEAVRGFAQGLRDWDPIFRDTDFKFTDGLNYFKRFKSLTIQKKNELVAYGLPVSMAPSLEANETKHLEAHDYHDMMTEPNTVIIDVRNHYEADIGHFQPPPGGAEFIDPKVRNSHELPKWLATPETKEQLKGKKVMMYCTGGIRCERFSALLSQMKADDPEFVTEGEYMVRGGIERYMRTFPEGGYWKGKNFLFDKRQEQVPANKSEAELDKELASVCTVCKNPWGLYRGAFKCGEKECQVPVIVCRECRESVEADQKKRNAIRCPLCEQGFTLRQLEAPKLHRAEKRKAGGAVQADAGNPCKKRNREKHLNKDPSVRLFVGNLPLVCDAQAITAAVWNPLKVLQWIPDRNTGLWYGNAFVEMHSLEEAKRVVDYAGPSGPGIKIGKRKLRVNFAPPVDGQVWPPADHVHRERPLVPVNPGV